VGELNKSKTDIKTDDDVEADKPVDEESNSIGASTLAADEDASGPQIKDGRGEANGAPKIAGPECHSSASTSQGATLHIFWSELLDSASCESMCRT
jgi:hypothetical protein